MQDHRKIRVWREAVELAVAVREATTHYPPRGYAELKAQTISSAESIVNNIVEGCGASTQREFARFLEMSIKLNKELEGQLELAAEYKILPREVWDDLAFRTINIRRGLIGLRKKVLRLDKPPDLAPNRDPDPPDDLGHDARPPSKSAKRKTHNPNR